MRSTPITSVLALAVLCSEVAAQVTVRASVSSQGSQGYGASHCFSNGIRSHFVAFGSDASSLVLGDTNNLADAFVRDLQLGTTERVSISSSGGQGNGATSAGCSVSMDGRFVAFDSTATNLVSGDTNGHIDVFVRDRQSGITELVSRTSTGALGNDNSGAPAMSGDGRYVSFTSGATNLVTGDTNNSYDVFVRDRQAGLTVRASVSSAGVQGNQGSSSASMSDDGRYVVFYGQSSNLATGDTTFLNKVFIRDLVGGTTELVSVNSAHQSANWNSSNPSVSGDGRFVAFESQASNLVSGDTNGCWDIFVRDRQQGTTERVSMSSAHVQANADCHGATLSADGRWVAFWTDASSLVSGDTNGVWDIFVHDRQLDTTERVSVGSSDVQANNGSRFQAISGDGRYIAFYGEASNLVSNDTNGVSDVFVRDLASAGFTSECDAGANGIAACPCGNPPGHPGVGCDNSFGTGGAHLSASGAAYLSGDHLTFSTSGEGPGSLSIVMQGNGKVPGGLAFGQGVRCLGGSIIRRLFIKHAVGGAIVAPDPSSGDPSVSVRSAMRGDTIHAGESRWYLVYYRDPIVLGGCPSGSTFNSTQTGRVTWTF